MRFRIEGMRTMHWFSLPRAGFLGRIFLLLMTGFMLAGGSAADEQGKTGADARFDGPAELPRIYIKSSLPDTPAPHRLRLVKSVDNLQQALNNAQCGDTLKLEAGATFRGLLVFPNKECDDSHWIILRTAARDDALPPEGERITHSYT